MSLFKLKEHPEFPNEYNFCENTGVLFYKKAVEREYSDSYFLNEYKSQYKKTYYEDEANLRALAKRRLQLLEKFQDKKNKSLLEIGSAAGFFLDEAKKIGYEVKGIEISNSEVQYSKQELNLDVECISIWNFTSNKKFNSIALFFVLEHFKEQENLFAKIFSLLEENGFLLLAIPSLFGPTFTTNPKDWLMNHPTDHFVDYSPKSIEKTLNYFGAKILYKEPMSYHPQRDKGVLGKFPFKYFYKEIANWICYGDTLFLIARRYK